MGSHQWKYVSACREINKFVATHYILIQTLFWCCSVEHDKNAMNYNFKTTLKAC